MRISLIGAVLAISVTAAAAQTGGGKAPDGATTQQHPAPATSGAAVRPRAPTGHRQPTQKDLPPATQKDESAPRAVDPLGPIPNICNPC